MDDLAQRLIWIVGSSRSGSTWLTKMLGSHDQVVPIDTGGRASARIVKDATLEVYPGAPHGVTETHKDQLNADLLGFVQERASPRMKQAAGVR